MQENGPALSSSALTLQTHISSATRRYTASLRVNTSDASLVHLPRSWPALQLGSMPYRNKQFWGRAFSFSPDGLSDEMDADCPALCPNQWSGPPDVRPKAHPELSWPSGKDHSNRSRPYPLRASVSDLRFRLRSHATLPPCRGPSITNLRPGCQSASH